MKFVNNERLDAIRKQYIEEYDENFKKICACDKTSDEYDILRKNEIRLQLRTVRFINKNAFYFSRKRRHHLELMEAKGVFGDRPVFESDGAKKIRCMSCGIVFEHFTLHRKCDKRQLCDECEYREDKRQNTLNRKKRLGLV